MKWSKSSRNCFEDFYSVENNKGVKIKNNREVAILSTGNSNFCY